MQGSFPEVLVCANIVTIVKIINAFYYACQNCVSINLNLLRNSDPEKKLLEGSKIVKFLGDLDQKLRAGLSTFFENTTPFFLTKPPL